MSVRVSRTRMSTTCARKVQPQRHPKPLSPHEIDGDLGQTQSKCIFKRQINCLIKIQMNKIQTDQGKRWYSLARDTPSILAAATLLPWVTSRALATAKRSKACT